MKKIVVVLVLAVLALMACATPYGKYGIAGSYTDSRIDANTFSISVDTNAFTSQQTTSMHAIYRAAELSVENGFDYFVTVSGANNPMGMAMIMPGTSTSVTSMNAYGYLLRRPELRRVTPQLPLFQWYFLTLCWLSNASKA